VADRRYILTIATGKKYFVDLAANLARSFLYWHTDSNITFQLVTDQAQSIPADIYDKIEIIPIKAGELGAGFSPKLHLDKLASDGQTLFIDSDCLIFEKLDHLFDRFKGRDVSVVGNYVSNGEWFGDVDSICRQFNLPHIPKFNGGLYYVEKGPKATEVFNTARQLEGRYDEIGFVRLRNCPNDEVLMALSMQLHGQTPLIDDGIIISDPQACPGGYTIDIIKGKRLLINPPPPHPLHQTWYPFINVSPAIFHFLGSYTSDYSYRMESYRLKKALSKKLNPLTEVWRLLEFKYPALLTTLFKNIFRPLYRKVRGYRKIKTSNRI
jgi:hypothetical protein